MGEVGEWKFIHCTFVLRFKLIQMKRNGFFKRIWWHLPYWIAILGLGYLFLKEKSNGRNRPLDQTSITTMEMARRVVRMHNSRQVLELSDLATAFPSPANEKIDSMARYADRLVRAFNDRTDLLKSDLSDSIVKTALRPAQIDWLETSAALLRDSLLLLADHDPHFKSSFPDPLPSGEHPPGFFWPANDREEAVLALENMMLRAEEGEAALLYHFASLSSGPHATFDRFAPVVVAQQPEIRAGAWYEAEIFLAAPYPQPDYIGIKVNGNDLKVRNGRSQFRQRYQEPGEKKYTVNIITTDPLTLQKRSYVKDFTVRVLPSTPK